MLQAVELEQELPSLVIDGGRLSSANVQSATHVALPTKAVPQRFLEVPTARRASIDASRFSTCMDPSQSNIGNLRRLLEADVESPLPGIGRLEGPPASRLSSRKHTSTSMASLIEATDAALRLRLPEAPARFLGAAKGEQTVVNGLSEATKAALRAPPGLPDTRRKAGSPCMDVEQRSMPGTKAFNTPVQSRRTRVIGSVSRERPATSFLPLPDLTGHQLSRPNSAHSCHSSRSANRQLAGRTGHARKPGA